MKSTERWEQQFVTRISKRTIRTRASVRVRGRKRPDSRRRRAERMIAMTPPKRPNLITARSAAACLLLTAASSCIVTTVEKLPPDLAPRAVREHKSWDVLREGEVVGSLHLLEILDSRGPVTMYHVRHADGQQAGWIEMNGRAFRDEPFRSGLQLVGMNTMAESLRALLELKGAPQVVAIDDEQETASETVEASFRLARR